MGFIRNTITLLTGNSIALAFSFLMMPILTRLYSPEIFGLMAIFLAIQSIGEIVSSLRYTHAILLPTKDEQAINLVYLSTIIVFSSSLIFLILTLFFKHIFISFFKLEYLHNWIFFLPLSTFLGGMYLVLYTWNVRCSNFRILTISRIIQAITLIGSQISLYYYFKDIRGLISGFIISQVIIFLLLLISLLSKDKILLLKIQNNELRQNFKRYNNFLKYSLPADIISTVSSQIPIVLISKYFGITQTGIYSLTNRVLATPISIIGNSILDTFKEAASKEYHKYNNCIYIYRRTFLVLSATSLLVFIVLYFSSPYIFSFVFGKEWALAGTYAQYLIPMFVIKFVASPLSYIIYLFEKQHYDLIWQIVLFFALSLGFIIGGEFQSIKLGLVLYSMLSAVMYIIYLIMSYRLAEGKNISK